MTRVELFGRAQIYLILGYAWGTREASSANGRPFPSQSIDFRRAAPIATFKARRPERSRHRSAACRRRALGSSQG